MSLKMDQKEISKIFKSVSSVEDLEKREQAIRDMAEIYDAIEKDVLPQLRKAKITIRSYEPKKPDSLILELAQNNAQELDVKELLYSASLTEDNKLKISDDILELQKRMQKPEALHPSNLHV